MKGFWLEAVAMVSGIVLGASLAYGWSQLEPGESTWREPHKQAVLDCRSTGGAALVNRAGRYEGCLLPPFVDR